MTVVKKDTLARAIGITARAVGASPVIPLLSNILFESSNGNSRVAATNLEIGISYTFPSKGKEFQTCIPAKTITSLVDALHAEEVELDLDIQNQSITISTETSTSQVLCASPEEFPDIPVVTQPTFTMPVAQFKEMVGRVAFAASKKDEHQGGPLAGTQISIEDGLLIMFAVDGFHMSYEDYPLSSENETENQSFIVKGPTLEMISKLLPDTGELEVEVQENKALFHCEDVNVITQLLGGAYPDYKMLRAAIHPPTTTLRIPTIELIRAVRQLRIFASETGASLLTVQGVLARYSSIAKDKGNSETTFVAVKKGNDISIGLNIKLLYELLEVCKTDFIIIEAESSTSMIVFKMDGFDNFFHVIMPINV